MIAAKSARLTYAAAGIAALLVLYPGLFRWPLIPEWRTGDQSIFLWHAEQMLHGRMLYRDLFQFNLPGTETLYYLLFRCFGVQLWVGPVAALLADVATVLLVLALSRRVLRGAAALFPAAVILLAYMPAHFEGTHHAYSTPLVLLAVWLIAGALDWKRLGAAGALLGLAGLFTSSRGVWATAAIVVFLLWKLGVKREGMKAAACVVAPFAGVMGGMLLYLAHTAGVQVMLNAVFVFPFRYFGATRGTNGFGAAWTEFLLGLSLADHSLRGAGLYTLALVTLLLCVVTPLILIVFWAKYVSSRGAAWKGLEARDTLVLYAMAGTALVLDVAHSASSTRLGAALSFSLILVTCWLSNLKSRQPLLILLIACVVLGSCVPVYRYYHSLLRLETPRGTIAVTESDYGTFTKVQQVTRRGGCYIADPDINFVLSLDNPTPLTWLTADQYTRPEQARDVVNALEKRRDCVVGWSTALDREGERGDNLEPLRDYLQANYHAISVDEFGDEVLVRKEERK